MVEPSFHLEQVKARLLTRRGDLQNRRTCVERDLARQNDPLVADASDQAIQLENDETLEAIGAAARQEIEAIDVALTQLERGRYGLCRLCGDEIPASRLQAVPQAVMCADCASP